MAFQVIIWDQDNNDLSIYLFEDRDMTLGSVLKSYTIYGNKINYENRYIYINNNGTVGTPLNDLNMTLNQYNIIHDDIEIVTLMISSRPNLFEHMESKPLKLAESLKL
ncbi:MAG: hypothetical protein CBC48_09050 [bacterium TMED88]|nr:MAG: hypothetical protein CBC48_09050 [bacterium TMED88]